MVAPVFITLPRPAHGCGRWHNIGDQSRLGDMTTVAAHSRAARLGKSCLRSGAVNAAIAELGKNNAPAVLPDIPAAWVLAPRRRRGNMFDNDEAIWRERMISCAGIFWQRCLDMCRYPRRCRMHVVRQRCSIS